MKSLLAGLVFLFISASAHAGFFDSMQYDCADENGNTLIVFYRFDYSPLVPRDLIFNGTKLPEVTDGVDDLKEFTLNGENYSLTFVGEEDLKAEIQGQSYTMKCARNWWPSLFSF